jgi:hypothetical protein
LDHAHRRRRVYRKIAMAGGALIAVAASLLGVSGLAGPTDTHLLLAVGTVVALELTRAQGRD